METVTREPIRLLEIERELAGPDKAVAFARYDGILARLGERLSAVLTEGLPPDEFPRVAALAEANTVARKILRLTVQADGRTIEEQQPTSKGTQTWQSRTR